MLRLQILLQVAFITCVGILGLSTEASSLKAQSTDRTGRNGTVLTGMVRAATGETLEGVTVSARTDGKTFTTSVFTDEQGNYFFPPLEKGTYRVWAQAVGFEAGRAEVNLDADGATHQDFTLQKARDFARQLSGAEWMAALPEDTSENRRMKDIFRNNCTGCHQTGYVLQNRFDEAGWLVVIELMGMMRNAYGTYAGPDRPPFPIIWYHREELAAYLAKMRGPGPSPMKFVLLPRPTGEAARAVDLTGEFCTIGEGKAIIGEGFLGL